MFAGAGKLGYPDSAMVAIALGCDMIAVGREAMMAIGCIQAQRCHNGHCPTGVATQSRWLTRGLDPADKAERTAHYIAGLRQELLRVAHAGGVAHPSLLDPTAVEIVDHSGRLVPVTDYYGVPAGVEHLGGSDRSELDASLG